MGERYVPIAMRDDKQNADLKLPATTAQKVLPDILHAEIERAA